MIPEGLPTLSAGSHEPHEGQACVMEFVSLLAGETWSDNPECTHRVLAQYGYTPLVEFLTGLIDEYDRLTGRTEHRQVSEAELSNLAARVAASSL